MFTLFHLFLFFFHTFFTHFHHIYSFSRLIDMVIHFFFLPIQSETVLSYNTGYPMGASSGCTVLCPHYLRELILFVFSLCLVAIHLCET